MKQIEAVIFDWAGTTVDYGCMAPVYAMKEAFLHFGLDITLDEIRKPMGILKIEHIKQILSLSHVQNQFKNKYQREVMPADIAQINQLFEKKIMTILNQHSQLITGLLPTQTYLREKKIKIGTTTGYTKEMLEIVANVAKAQGYQPDYLIASDQVACGRPSADMIQQNFSALNIQDARSVVKVGDTLVDIEEGLNAGCWSIGVIKGGSMLGLTVDEVNTISTQELNNKMNSVRKAMLAHGAHCVLDSIAELPQAITFLEKNP